MNTPLPPEPNRADPLYQKIYSLGKGAGFLGVSKTTLRGAIERGEVAARRNEQGHYLIHGDEIYQYQARLYEEGVRKGGTDPVQSPGSAPPVEGVQEEVQEGVQIPGAVPRDLHEEIVDLYKRQLVDKDATITTLRSDIEYGRTQHESTVKLLTYDLGRPDEPPESGAGHWAWWILGLAILLIGVALYVFREELEALLLQM